MTARSQLKMPALDKDMPGGRRDLYLHGPFPAKVRGVDACGVPFKADAEVEVISIREVHLCLGREVAAGAPILIVTRFSKAWSDRLGAPTVALRGTVLREGPGEGGCVIILIERTRFL